MIPITPTPPPPPKYSFSPIFNFNQIFYGFLRGIYGNSRHWKDQATDFTRILSVEFSLTEDRYILPRFYNYTKRVMFPIKYKTLLHKIKGDGMIEKNKVNQVYFDEYMQNESRFIGFMMKESFEEKFAFVNGFLELINQCYTWHLQDPSQHESTQAQIESKIKELCENTKSLRWIDSHQNNRMLQDLKNTWDKVKTFHKLSPVSELQKLTMELMIDINSAMIRLSQDQHALIQPATPLLSVEWINFESLEPYLQDLPTFSYKKLEYYRLKDMQNALQRYLDEYFEPQLKERDQAGQNFIHALSRNVYWHNFKYDQATPEEITDVKDYEAYQGNDLFNIYMCFNEAIMDFKRSNSDVEFYPYLTDAESAEYIRATFPDFEPKLKQMAQLLNWDQQLEKYFDSLKVRTAEQRKYYADKQSLS